MWPRLGEELRLPVWAGKRREGVHGGDALDGGVEFVKEVIGDARGEFGKAVAPTQHVFVGDD